MPSVAPPRFAHVAGYEQFILGDEIAMIAIFVEKARLCNVRDEVSHWAVGPRQAQGQTRSGESPSPSPPAVPSVPRTPAAAAAVPVSLNPSC